MLSTLKSGLAYDLLEPVTGMNGSSATRNRSLGLTVLLQALATSGHAPKRSFRSAEEFQIYFLEHKMLIIYDAIEQRTERPKAAK